MNTYHTYEEKIEIIKNLFSQLGSCDDEHLINLKSIFNSKKNPSDELLDTILLYIEKSLTIIKGYEKEKVILQQQQVKKEQQKRDLEQKQADKYLEENLDSL